jgi:ketosteroid isomerase-like protein
MKNTLLLLLFLPAFLLAQQTSDDEAIIRKNLTVFSQAVMDGDYDAVVNTYTADAKIFPNDLEILSGENAIRDYWTPAENRSWKTTYHHLMPEEIKIIGDTAYDYGYYEGRSMNVAGEESYFKGKYVVVWKKESPGVWKIYLDIWNRVKV